MRLAFVASETNVAQQARRKLVERYGDVPATDAEVIIALGGDGFMLRTLHAHRAIAAPVYGMKLGRVGFLMNKHRIDELPERIERAHAAELFPLEMVATDADGQTRRALAFNEVSLLRQTQSGRASGGETQRYREARNLGMRWHPGLHACRFHRLQPFRAWSDLAARRQRAGVDPDQPVPAASLAWRDPAASHACQLARAGPRQAPGQRDRRFP